MGDGEKSEQGGRRYRVKQSSQPGHAASRPCKSCMPQPHHIPAGLMCTLPVLGLIEDGPLQTKTTAKVQTQKEAQPCHKHLLGIYYTHSRSRHE